MQFLRVRSCCKIGPWRFKTMPPVDPPRSGTRPPQVRDAWRHSQGDSARCTCAALRQTGPPARPAAGRCLTTPERFVWPVLNRRLGAARASVFFCFFVRLLFGGVHKTYILILRTYANRAKKCCFLIFPSPKLETRGLWLSFQPFGPSTVDRVHLCGYAIHIATTRNFGHWLPWTGPFALLDQ